jgi:uncharacterized membrane protein YfhO
MWIIPTQASLTLLKAAYNWVSIGEIILSISILLLYIIFAWNWAIREYAKRMLES